MPHRALSKSKFETALIGCKLLEIDLLTVALPQTARMAWATPGLSVFIYLVPFFGRCSTVRAPHVGLALFKLL